jgi:D-alanyl-D-alanine carboxypeptidase (penicillin-binding protein 5/6)
MTLFRLTKISILSCLLSAFCQVTSSYAIDTKAKHSFMIDMNTHTVLMNKAGDELMPPSSMSKLMTIYILFSRLAEGRVKLDSKFTVSEKAWRTQGSKTFVGIGSEIAVEDLIHGITTQSGNDACVVVAEGLSGTEEAFAAEMNRVAKTIGLEHSHFINATGLPDDNHIMTARDLATLAERLIVDFPQYYHYFSTREYTYNNIKQQNRNRLLGGSIGVDGLKTGHTEAGGYGITLSALQEGRRLILVVNGLESDNDRVEEGEKLMRWGFREFENKTLLQKGQVVADADVWFGKSSTVALTSDKDIVVTLPANMKNDVKFILKYNAPLPAPITKGTHVADLVINIPGSDAQTIPLLANDDVEKLSGFSRMSAVASYYLHSSK